MKRGWVARRSWMRGGQVGVDLVEGLPELVIGGGPEGADTGQGHAGLLLTRRAVADGDLIELQRIEEASRELERLLRA